MNRLTKFSTLAAFVLGLASPAAAAPLSADWYITNASIGLNFHFTMAVEEVGSNYDVQFTVLNEGTLAGFYRGFGVKNLFQDEVSGVGSNWFSATKYAGATSTTLTQFKGGLNLKTSQSDYCKDGDNGHEGMVCSELKAAGNDVRLYTNESIVFRFLVTGADPSTDIWHLQTKVFSGPRDNAGLGSISEDAVPRRPPTELPEPASLTLLGAGMVASLFGRRRTG